MNGINILRSFGITKDCFRKALNRDGLVRKKVQVRMKSGIYTSYRWVKPDKSIIVEGSHKEEIKFSDEEWLKNGGDDGDYSQKVGKEYRQFVADFDKDWEKNYKGNPQNFKDFLLSPIPKGLKGVISNKLIAYMKYCAKKDKVNMLLETGLLDNLGIREFHGTISVWAQNSDYFRSFYKDKSSHKGYKAFKWLTDNMRTDSKEVTRIVDVRHITDNFKEFISYWKGKIGKTIENGDKSVFFESVNDTSIRKVYDRTLESFTTDFKKIEKMPQFAINSSKVKFLYKNEKGIIGCDISGAVKYDEKEIIVGDHKKYKVLSVEKVANTSGKGPKAIYNIVFEQLEN